MFGSKYRRSVYELEQFPNNNDEAYFDIYSSIDMIQAYVSQQRSSSSKIPKEQ